MVYAVICHSLLLLIMNGYWLAFGIEITSLENTIRLQYYNKVADNAAPLCIK